MHTFKKAFTLAEVLITLLIIGVIASIVIPGIINDTKDAEYNAGVKKAYADLSAAVQMIQANNGGSIAVGTGNTNADCTAFRNEFCNVMTCTKKDTEPNIFGVTMYKYYKSGDWQKFTWNSDLAATLNNGTLLSFNSWASCNNYGVNMCGYIWVDINGQKGPNMLGKDLYMFYVIRQNGTGPYSILPTGVSWDRGLSYPNYCTVGGGIGCAYKRLYDSENMP